MPFSKIFNDPVYGFITIHDRLIQELIDHPYFQRLGRIAQLGMSGLVYPGARHTRFHHALGAMHLMKQAIDILKSKGTEISEHESRAAMIAILLHDIGHGPFSHTLEHSILEGYDHEDISLQMMQRLNETFDGALQTAIDIFTGNYSRHFFHQLVSGQLDVDRLDYLMRDSFYTGVAEGVIGGERIIKMMYVVDDELCIEEKGIYSIEKFLIARRLMYWQVYLHKTVIAAEMLMLLIMRRARFLSANQVKLFATTAFSKFLYPVSSDSSSYLSDFALLDDMDVMASVKEWTRHPDPVLSSLCTRMINRKLFRAVWLSKAPSEPLIENMVSQIAKQSGLSNQDARYFIKWDKIVQLPYDISKGEIWIHTKSGQKMNIFDASDNLSYDQLSQPVTKYIICYPKELNIIHEE